MSYLLYKKTARCTFTCGTLFDSSLFQVYEQIISSSLDRYKCTYHNWQAVKKKNEPSIFHLFKFDQVKARVAGATQTLKCNFLVLSLLSVIIFNWALFSCDCKQVAAQGVPSFTFCPFDRLWAKSCLLGRFSVETGWTECPLVSLCWLPVSRFSPQTWCCGLSAGSGGAGSEDPMGLTIGFSVVRPNANMRCKLFPKFPCLWTVAVMSPARFYWLNADQTTKRSRI